MRRERTSAHENRAILDISGISSDFHRSIKDEKNLPHFQKIWYGIIGGLSQQQMVIPKQEHEPLKSETSGAPITAWYIMIGDATALCRCVLTGACALGNNSLSLANVIHPGHVTSVNTSKTCRFGRGRIVVRTAAWEWTATRIARLTSTSGSLPGLGHTLSFECGVLHESAGIQTL